MGDHPPIAVWNDLCEDIRSAPRYRHYKGGFYRVLTAHAVAEATGERMVVYFTDGPLRGRETIWIRPYAEFFSTVTLDTGEKVLRFVKHTGPSW